MEKSKTATNKNKKNEEAFLSTAQIPKIQTAEGWKRGKMQKNSKSDKRSVA